MNKNLITHFFSEASSRIAWTGINQISMLLVIVILSIRLNLNDLGTISFLFISNQIFLTFSNLGFGDQSHELLSKKSGANNLKLLIKNILIWKIFIFIFFIFFTNFLYFFNVLPIKNFNYLIILNLLNLLTIFNFNFIVLALKKTSKVLIYIGLIRTLFLIFTFIFCNNSGDILIFYFIFFFDRLLIAFVEIFYIKKIFFESLVLKTKIRQFKKFVKISFSFFLTYFINNKFIIIWSPFVITGLGLVQIAIFGIIEQIIRSGSDLSQMIAQVFQINKRSRNISKIFIYYFLFLLVITIILFMNMDIIMTYIFNNKFKNHILEFQVALIILYLNSLIKTFFYSFYYNNKTSNKITYITILFHAVGLIIWWSSITNNTLNILYIILIILILQTIIIFTAKFKNEI